MKECVICKQDIKPNAIGWEHGNNAQPVAEGQCCDECNTNKVIPARLGIPAGLATHIFGEDR